MGNQRWQIDQVFDTLLDIEVPAVRPIDVRAIVREPQYKPSLLPGALACAITMILVLLGLHTLGVDFGWAIPLTALGFVGACVELITSGPFGLGLSEVLSEHSVWFAGVMLAALGLTGVVLMAIVERIEPHRA